jgi:hypothetical protein
VNPTQLAFPTTSPGQSSPAQTVTITNTANVAASSLTLLVGSQFSLTQNTCPSSLATGANCTAGVIFQPIGSGIVTGELTVSSTTMATSATVALSGTGGGMGSINVAPAVIGFGSIGAGETSIVNTVTVTNPGTTSALNDLQLAVPAGFQLVNNTCATTLGPGLSCTAGVAFAPITAGAVSGNLTVTSSTASASAEVSLAGTGFDFTVTAPGSTSQTVSSGLTADYTLVLTPLNGSQGTFAFHCGTLPANALCQFSPSGETVGAGIQGNVTVQIATGQSGSSARSIPPVGLGLIPLVCGLLALPMGWRRRRNALMLAALLAISAGGVASCTSSGGGSGGSGGGSSSGATPTGTYTIPVTVVSTGVQHGLTVTLTVD